MPNWPGSNSWPASRNWPTSNSWPAGFNPASLPGLALWLDGRQAGAAFSDIGATVPAPEPTGLVRVFNQATPAIGVWQAASDAVRTLRGVGELHFSRGVLAALAQPAGVTVPGNNNTILVSGQVRAEVDFVVLLWGLDAVGRFGIFIADGGVYIQSKGVQWGPLFNITVCSTFAISIKSDAAGITVNAKVNGVSTQYFSADAALPSGGTGSFVVGSNGTGGLSQWGLCQIVGYSSALTAADISSLVVWAYGQVPGAPIDAPLVVWVGDSLGRGFGANAATSEAYLSEKNLAAANPSAPPRMINCCANGKDVAVATTQYAGTVATVYSTSRAKNILVVQVMAASCVDGSGLTAAQVLTQLYSYCDTARADGWKVVLGTVSPITNAGVGVGFDARRLSVNASITGGPGATHSDAICDVAAVAGISLLSDCSGPNYLADNQHYSNSGHALAEVAWRAAIASLL